MSYRIGFGVDFHQLKKGRDLWIGGIKIDHDKGAVGHSDADVLLHALCDALFGALGLDDIGVHFPDTDPEYKNIDSKILLRRTKNKVHENGYKVVNIDSTVCLQEPKLRKYIQEMKREIAGITGINESDVSIKATTTEQMGFVGKGKGLVAYVTVLLHKTG